MDIGEEIARASVRGSIYLFLGTTLSTLLTALASILFGRLLGPADYGLYSLSLTPSSLLLIGTNFGLNVGIVKYLSEYQRKGNYGKIRSLVKKALLFQLATGSILTLILFTNPEIFATYIINRPEAAPYIQITSIYILGMVLFTTLNQSFIGLNRMERTSLTMLTQALTKLGVGVGLVLLGLGVMGAVTGHSISYLIGVGAGLILMAKLLKKREEEDIDPDDDTGILDLIRFGFPVYIGAITFTLLGVYRNYLLSLYTTNIDIGNFQAAMNLSTALVIFINPVVSTLFSSFSRLDKTQELHIIRDLFAHSVKYSAIMILPITLFLYITSTEVIKLVYGAGYETAATYLIIAAAPYLFIGAGIQIINSLLNGLGETKTVLKMFIITFIVSIPLYLILIQTYGVIGILISMFIAAVAALAYGLNYATKKYTLKIRIGEVTRVYVTAILTAIAVLAIKTVVGISRPLYAVVAYGLIYLAIYMLLLPTLGGLTQRDLNTLERSFRGLGFIGYPILLLLNLERKLCKK